MSDKAGAQTKRRSETERLEEFGDSTALVW